jgi:molybdopterin-guanine dinucleotide biosynthesis protein A
MVEPDRTPGRGACVSETQSSASRGLTGVLLVGGASSRFGSPKALARLRGETLAERAWRTLGEACEERIAVGKGDLPLPFGVGLRAAAHETVVFLPVDCPLVTPQLLRELGQYAAVPQTGPLPGAYTKEDLPELERRLAAHDYTLRGVNLRVREVDVRLLADVDAPDALSAIEEHLAALDDHLA